jgi:hypothetical protein
MPGAKGLLGAAGKPGAAGMLGATGKPGAAGMLGAAGKPGAARAPGAAASPCGQVVVKEMPRTVEASGSAAAKFCAAFVVTGFAAAFEALVVPGGAIHSIQESASAQTVGR